jgi:hypothetical protein
MLEKQQRLHVNDSQWGPTGYDSRHCQLAKIHIHVQGSSPGLPELGVEWSSEVFHRQLQNEGLGHLLQLS